MKEVFDKVSNKCSEITTKYYSTSFSFGIKALDKKLHKPIYNIYGFVRFADEIVDTFHDYDKKKLFYHFKEETINSLKDKISLNPILNSFQKTVHQYNIEWNLIDTFLKSMEMDLEKRVYDKEKYKQYILGSAEVVGLMCLRVFVLGNEKKYKKLKPYAMTLGSAFQKINFLRDINNDFQHLGRTYFPEIDLNTFSQKEKEKIENDIENDFQKALKGIQQLPITSRGGVYLAYIYYYSLFKKIKTLPASKILEKRIRISNSYKLLLMIQSKIKNKLNII